MRQFTQKEKHIFERKLNILFGKQFGNIYQGP